MIESESTNYNNTDLHNQVGEFNSSTTNNIETHQHATNQSEHEVNTNLHKLEPESNIVTSQVILVKLTTSRS